MNIWKKSKLKLYSSKKNLIGVIGDHLKMNFFQILLIYTFYFLKEWK